MKLRVCDICRKELNDADWEDSTNWATIIIQQSSLNPLQKYDKNSDFKKATLHMPDLCFKCVRIISEGIADLLVKNKNTNTLQIIEKSEKST